MNEQQVIEVAGIALMAAAKILFPLLGVTLFVGVVISLLQAVTQVQEFTLTFVPKLAGIGVVIILGGRWMLGVFIATVHELFDMLPTLLGGG